MDLCAFILNLPTWLERRRWEKEDEKRKKTNKIMENKENFKLKDFRLSKEYIYSSGGSPGYYEYVGCIEYKNGNSESFTLKLDPELSLKVLDIIKDKLAENSKQLVKNIQETIDNGKRNF